MLSGEKFKINKLKNRSFKIFFIKKVPIRVFFGSLAAIILIFCLTSCSAIPGYSEPEEQSIVCAIGFDVEDERIRVTLQLAESGGKDFREVEGEGGSIDEAISYIASKETSSLEVAHLAVVVLGRGIDASRFDTILDFCERNDSISSSARLISSSDASALLSCEGVTGYKLSEMISSSREDSSYGAHSRLYKIKNTLLSDDPTFALPHFFADGEDFELYGLRIFRSGEALSVLDREEGAYYMMIRGDYDGGILGGDATGLAASVGVSKCVTAYTVDAEGKGVTVRLLLSLDSEIADEEHSSAILKATAENARELYEKLSSLHGDVFGIGRIAERGGIGKDAPLSELTVKFECEKRR